MFLFKLFGTLDVLAGTTLVLIHYDIMGVRPAIMFGAYLGMKGFLFQWDVLSIVDFLVAGYLIISLFGSWLPLTIVLSAYLLVKGVWSWR